VQENKNRSGAIETILIAQCQPPSKRRTDGRTVCPSVRPSVRLLDGIWHIESDQAVTTMTLFIYSLFMYLFIYSLINLPIRSATESSVEYVAAVVVVLALSAAPRCVALVTIDRITDVDSMLPTQKKHQRMLNKL